jgi:hypothetical protein
VIKVWTRQQQYCTACALAVLIGFALVCLYLNPTGFAGLNPFGGENCDSYEQYNALSNQHSSKDAPTGTESVESRRTSNSKKDSAGAQNQPPTNADYYACRLAAYTHQLALFTAGLAFATVALIIIGIYQGYQLGRHATVAERTLTELERAYVFSSHLIMMVIGGKLTVQYRMRNNGRTPAIIKECRVSFVAELPTGLCYDPGESEIFNWAIAATDSGDTKEFVSPIEGTQLILMFVRYFDIFGKEQFSRMGNKWTAKCGSTFEGDITEDGGDPYNSWT